MVDGGPGARRRVAVSWSSGKDSAWTLRRLLDDGAWDVVALLTTVVEPAGEVTMHGVPRELLRAQARRVGVPLLEVALADPCPPERYAALMRAALDDLRAAGAEHVAFGDLFLEDLRARREANMAGTGLGTTFPLWRSDTRALAVEMVEAGLRATLVSVDTAALDPSFLGRPFSLELLDALPPGVDPCGENGEFHTFVHDAPFFDAPVPFELGEVRTGAGFARVALRPPRPGP